MMNLWIKKYIYIALVYEHTHTHMYFAVLNKMYNLNCIHFYFI